MRYSLRERHIFPEFDEIVKPWYTDYAKRR
jgi:hypothetical protein